MYTKKDYLIRGGILVNNHLRPTKKKLASLMFYATNKCDSMCKHCFIWSMKEKQELCLQDIINVMNSKAVLPSTSVGLEGGEFLLHSQAEEILGWFQKYHSNYHLLSNALQEERLLHAVKRYKPKRVYISLDGDRKTYARMRGVIGYDKVIRSIEKVKKYVPVSVMYTQSPFNSQEDMQHVIDYCEQQKIDMRVGIYNEINYFETRKKAHSNSSQDIPEGILQFSENYDFLKLYEYWQNGELKIPCLSIFDSFVVLPDGTVPLCQTTGKPLGNIHDEDFDTIINKADSIRLQKEYSKNCNACWVNYHRKYDVALLRSMEAVLPKFAVEKLIGKPYQWNEKESAYKELIQVVPDAVPLHKKRKTIS